MTLADSSEWAFAVTAVVAVLARLAGALTTGGTIAGAVVGACVSAGFGLPGLAVGAGTFFVVGTVATRIGWEKKKARGTAEAGEGRRDWRRVLGKGGVAAGIALLYVFRTPSWAWSGAFAGAISAALADTLGTEIGGLQTGRCLAVPRMHLVPSGTPGAMSLLGTAATIVGGALVAAVAWHTTLLPSIVDDFHPDGPPWIHFAYAVAAAGPVASCCESIAVGLGLRAPGFVRNVLTTMVGALVGGIVTINV